MKIERPFRVTRRYTQRLVARVSDVFPLLCPVREADWIEGWSPIVVYSESGLAEAGCVFVTPAEPQDAVWFINRHEPETGIIEMIKVAPGVTVSHLRIELHDLAEGCSALIAYTLTAIGTQGKAAVDAFTEAYYTEFMQTWERRMNHWLEHGTCLASGEGG